MSVSVLAAVWVAGIPRPKGSMTPLGRGAMTDTPQSKAWRHLVAAEVARDMRARGAVPASGPWEPYTKPVAVRCVFVRADGQGDVDKLARNVLDALTDSRVIGDDVQVVSLDCVRVASYPGRGDGAFVVVWPFPMAEVDTVAQAWGSWAGNLGWRP